MSFELHEPVLVVGLGGLGSKLAAEASESFGSKCLIISNDQRDLSSENHHYSSIHISTKPVLNPSIQLVRASTMQAETQIGKEISEYSSVIILANLAGKSGAAMAPVISQICKEAKKKVISFVVMPFKYEKNRIFNSGISLKRVKANSNCTVVIDNDAFLDSNPNLSQKTCYNITNSAVLHVIRSLKESTSSSIHEESHLLTTSKNHHDDIESSLRDSMKMLYQNAPPNAVKRSILYVIGGENASVGMMNTISSLSSSILGEEDEDNGSAQIDMSTVSSEESKVVMLSSIQGATRFDKYDPLGVIPKENTLDWDDPECSINCNLELYQLE